MSGHAPAFAVLALLLPVTALAQTAPAHGSPPGGITVTWNAPPPPPSPPVPPAAQGPGGRGDGPSRGQGDMAGTGDQFRAGPFTYAPRYDRFSNRQRGRRGFKDGYAPWYGGYVPFGYSVYADPADYMRDWRSEPESTGRLLLQVSPGSAQVFVDGFYYGVVDDSSERGLWLEPGPHRVELRADGYETVTFDVRIAEGETVDYRRVLAQETAPVEPPRRAAATPKAFYVIRGCYAGDSMPDAARLPAGCRAADVRVIPPVVSLTNK